MSTVPTTRTIRARDFSAARAWDADTIATINGVTTRLHWADQPYHWHVNDGDEVLAVLDGTVDMYYREGGVERTVTLETGDVFYAGAGCAHVAHPRGVARMLVVERAGSD